MVQVFPCEFAQIFQKRFLQITSEQLKLILQLILIFNTLQTLLCKDLKNVAKVSEMSS